jgi:hypothetical protein
MNTAWPVILFYKYVPIADPRHSLRSNVRSAVRSA